MPVAVAPPPLQPQPPAVVTGQLLPAAPQAHLGNGSLDIPATLAERLELCKFLAEADLLPKALIKRPANILLIMHKALALGIPMSVGFEQLYVIDGKVGYSAELLRALLYPHGHILRWPTKTDKEVVGELILRHDPKNPRRERFTMADATRMGLTSKDNWRKDPESMMVARCTTRLISRHCPEVAVALGNLSAIDIEDDHTAPPVHATAEVIDRDTENAKDAIAHELFAEANAAENSEALKAIGRRAQQAGVLEIPVDGLVTLQAALLQRINEIAEDRKPATKKQGTSG